MPVFGKGVFTLIGGTSVALLVQFLASPIISRLYSPSMYGELALYVSVVSIGAIVATGRYELALPIPQSAKLARSALHVAVACTAATVLLLGVCFLLAVAVLPAGSVLDPVVWVLLVPLGVLSVAALQTLTYWRSRELSYRLVAIGRGIQALAMTAVQILIGAVSPSSYGLIAGHLGGAAIAAFALVAGGAGGLSRLAQGVTLKRMSVAAKKFSKFPQFLIAGHLANAVSSQLPVITLALLFGPAEAGLYAFAERMTVMPCALVAASVGDVYRQVAAKAFQERGECREAFLAALRRLIAMATVFAGSVVIIAPLVFDEVFGEAWVQAGEISAILAIVIFFQTISSPLGQTVLLSAMYRADLVWQFSRLVASVLGLCLGYWIYDSFVMSIMFHCCAFAVCYLAHSVMQFRAASGAAAKARLSRQ
jgi:O-antigen/teichoic acid export membrane protein